jgi:hypothetical protein
MSESKISITKGNKEMFIGISDLVTEISQCLQSENLNFLVGSGCSSYRDEADSELGIPTMSMLAQMFYEKNPKFYISSKKLAKDMFPDNLEALINYLVSIHNICAPSQSSKIMKKIETINHFIFDQICDTEYSTVILDLYKEFYLRIVKKTRKIPINVYTTNYDLYNETALDELGFMYNNGFMGSSKRIFNPNSYNYILVENLNLSKDVWQSVNNFINFYKIHGSINWIKEDDNKINTSRIIEKDLQLIKINKDYKSIMIYPTPQKDRSTLMVPYSDLFRIMQNNLLKSNSVLITMGYSFNDEHINRIILNALSVYDFKLIIFGKTDMIEKLKSIGDKRIWVINSQDEIHYFKNIVNKSLPSIDEEQHEMQEIKTSLIKLNTLLNGGDSDAQ